MFSKLSLILLCLAIVGLAAGCGPSKEQVNAAAAKEWTKSAPPADYMARAMGMAAGPAVHGGAPVQGGPPAANK